MDRAAHTMVLREAFKFGLLVAQNGMFIDARV